MLRLISTKPADICMYIDAAFSKEPVGSHIHSIDLLLRKYTDVRIIDPASAASTDHPDCVIVSGKFGRTNLSKIATGYKVLLLAYLYTATGRSFCCPEFCVGANMIPALAEIAKDSDNISLWCPRLDLSQHYDTKQLVEVLADGEVKQICC